MKFRQIIKAIVPFKLSIIISNIFSRNILNIFKRKFDYFDIRENSVLLIEFYKVHGESLPGHAKYFLDLNYNIDVVINCKGKNDIGLFSCFNTNKKVRVKILSDYDMNYLMRSPVISNYKHIMINSLDNKCELNHLAFVNLFKLKPVCAIHNPNLLSKYFKTNKIISHVKIESKNRKSPVIVNPHYFCDYRRRERKCENSNITTFTAFNNNDLLRRNINLLFNACDMLYEKGISNFNIKVIGKGLPILDCFNKNIQNFGFLDFQSMYKEIIDSDFFIALLDEESKQYTNKASGSYQISYGFLKPLLLHSQFSKISYLNNDNSILYDSNGNLAEAMERCINMTNNEYLSIVNSLEKTKNDLYNVSLKNFKEVLEAPLELIK